MGTVKSSSHKFGFVTCPEAQAKYGADVFCLGDQLAIYNIGETVQVEIGIQQSDGKPVAISVTGEKGVTTTFRDGSGKNKAKGKAKAAAMWAMWGPWGPPWMWGMGGWGDDMGWGGAKGAMGMGGADKGKGKDEGKGAAARAAFWEEIEKLQTKGSTGTGKGAYTTWGGGQPHPGAGAPKRRPESTGEVFVGVVKSCSQKFGFITCDEITQAYGCDCFCLGEQLFGHFNQGDMVEFEVGINDKGQPQAINISYPDPAGGPPKKRLRATPLVVKPDDKPRIAPTVNPAMAANPMANWAFGLT